VVVGEEEKENQLVYLYLSAIPGMEVTSILGSFQAAVLLPVNIWHILELRFTFEEGPD
jgi:hypothetical protein